MSHLVMIERSFTARRKAERWFDSLRPKVWPYIWCSHDATTRQWNVTALLEQEQLPAVVSNIDMDGYTVKSCH